jgi:O-antigen/teichoic acid export membrane protein
MAALDGAPGGSAQRPPFDRLPIAGLRRAGWGLADQSFSSLTNFALGLIVVRSVDLADFGAFSLALAAYFFAVSVSRTYPMDPFVIRYGRAPATVFRHAAGAATGTALGAGLVGGVVLLGCGALVGGGVGVVFVGLGVALPGLLLQDAWRSVFFAAGRGRSAFINDAVWALVEFPALAIVIVSGNHTVVWPVVAWGGGATVAAVLGVWQSGVVPRPDRAREWWRGQIDIGPRFLAEAVGRLTASQLVVYGVGAVSGLAAVGALRAGWLLLGPVQVVSMGISIMSVPEGVRALGVSVHRLDRTAAVISLGLSAAVVAWVVFVLAIPASVGAVLLRASWMPAHALVLPLALASLGYMLSAGPQMGLRALAAARRSLRVTLFSSIVSLAAAVVGALLGGASGAAWGLAVASFIGAAAYLRAYRHETRLYQARADAAEPAPPIARPRASDTADILAAAEDTAGTDGRG